MAERLVAIDVEITPPSVLVRVRAWVRVGVRAPSSNPSPSPNPNPNANPNQVTVSDGNERPPPYLLENRTDLALRLHQKGAPTTLRRTLPPHSRVVSPNSNPNLNPNPNPTPTPTPTPKHRRGCRSSGRRGRPLPPARRRAAAG